MVNDPNNGEIAWIRLTSCSFPSSRAADANHPITWLRANSINGNLLSAAVQNNLKVLVFEIRNAIGRNQWLDDLDDKHDQ